MDLLDFGLIPISWGLGIALAAVRSKNAEFKHNSLLLAMSLELSGIGWMLWCLAQELMK